MGSGLLTSRPARGSQSETWRSSEISSSMFQVIYIYSCQSLENGVMCRGSCCYSFSQLQSVLLLELHGSQASSHCVFYYDQQSSCEEQLGKYQQASTCALTLIHKISSRHQNETRCTTAAKTHSQISISILGNHRWC